MHETQFQSLGQEDPLEKGMALEKEMAAHSSILARKIPWTVEPGRLPPWGRKESEAIERLHFHFHPLQYSCLENSM